MTYIQNPDSIVVDLRPGRTKDNDSSICCSLYHVVPDNTIATAYANAVCPLLKIVGSTWPNIIVLDCNSLALQRAFSNVQTRPASGVERLHILNELVSVGVAEFDVTASLSRFSAITCAIDLRQE